MQKQDSVPLTPPIYVLFQYIGFPLGRVALDQVLAHRSNFEIQEFVTISGDKQNKNCDQRQGFV
ncbi:hypothetical protein VB10N_23690 [Vibrio sp. 10N]|nr:hypothetical protein VB10N_23690 [Vibrio sp. 10N]